MKLGPSLAVSLASLLAAATIPGACGNDGIVGGSCRRGLSNCSNHCVNLETDPDNCGRCGKRCADGIACLKGLCGVNGDGGWGGEDGYAGSGNHRRDGGYSGTTDVDGGTETDGFVEFDVRYPDGTAGGATSTNSGSGSTSTNPGSGSTSTNPGSGSTSAGGTSSSSVDICTPPYDTAQNCGECHHVCTYPNRVCAPVEGAYSCVPLCELPLVECNSTCVDLNSDSDNCGQCGRACPSAICQGGQCIGARAGHIVIIGMNFRETTPDAQPTYLLGNAVLLPRFEPVKILAYTEFADPNVATAVDTTIGWAATSIIGRDVAITHVSQAQAVNDRLKKPDFDTFLVYEQAKAPSGTLADYGTQWAKTLESFSYVGGVIVILSGSTGVREMPQFLTNSRLLEVSAETSVSRSHIFNREQGDSIGTGVLDEFLAPWDTCTFDTPTPTDSSTVFVVTDGAPTPAERRPVVVHRIAIPQVN